MTQHLSLQDQTTEFLLYTAPSGAIKVEVLLSGETLWLTQRRMAELFGVQRPSITRPNRKPYNQERGEKWLIAPDPL